ncbi:unnamed protein product, partial [Mesorhabditis belari]|uniref:TSC22 domain family protein 1 n=1 Tax=Mesorhabditis belari TaxID=2138241 RepID=A0AAF3EUW8_9BILA
MRGIDLEPQPEEALTPAEDTSSANATASTPPMVAIDSKIEQAMDLVKTHLMFAVREEVEVLRARIVDLEGHVHHLEAENNVLRSHVPDDVLKKMNLH